MIDLYSLCLGFTGPSIGADIEGDKELLHGHQVDLGEVLGDVPATHLHLRLAEVVLDKDDHLFDHISVGEVDLDVIKTSGAIITSESIILLDHSRSTLHGAGMHELAHVHGTLLDKLMNNHAKDLGVVLFEVVETVLALDSWAVLLLEEANDFLLHGFGEASQLVHLHGALLAGELGLGPGQEDQQDGKGDGGLHDLLE